MSGPRSILAFGELLWDLLPGGAATLGGAPFNFAYRVKEQGDRARIVSRLGRDDYGRRAAERLAALGMSDACVQWDDRRPTGTVIVSLDGAGQPDYVIVPDVAYDRVEATDAVLTEAARADCICFGTLIQRTAGARAALRAILDAAPATAVRLLDINLRKDCHSPESIAASLEEATILKLNETEAAALAGLFDLPDRSIPAFCAEMIGRWDLTHCVVTLGACGAFADGAETGPVYEPGYRVAMVDPLGSGDAFVAAFICRLLRGEPLGTCLHHGNVLGAIVATQAGATEPIDSEVREAFTASHHERLVEPSLKTFMNG
ncbi:MAG: hypothetical protein GX591_06860 [Planctomycetes bacterium]|nr:hypothetical protein [Planctomycetota bacterium]